MNNMKIKCPKCGHIDSEWRLKNDSNTKIFFTKEDNVIGINIDDITRKYDISCYKCGYEVKDMLFPDLSSILTSTF